MASGGPEEDVLSEPDIDYLSVEVFSDEDDDLSETDSDHLSVAIGSDLDDQLAHYHPVLHRRWGPQVNSSLISVDDSCAERSTTHLLEDLGDDDQQTKVRTTLVRHRIPRLAEEQNLIELLQCSVARDRRIKDSAVVLLETTLLQLRDFHVVTGDLKIVASSALNSFLKEKTSAKEVYLWLHLHLLSTSIFLRHGHQEDSIVSFFLPFISMLREQERVRDEPEFKKRAITALKAFHKSFTDDSKRRAAFMPPPDWVSLNWGQSGSQERRKSLQYVSFAHHIVYMYSLLSEIMDQATGQLSGTFLQLLQELCDAVPRPHTHEQKMCEEVTGFILVRCLSTILGSLFTRDRASVGKSEDVDQNDLISSMIMKVITESKEPFHRQLLIQEVRQLSFHNSHTVRQVFNCYLSSKKTKVPFEQCWEAVIKFMEKNLHLLGFQKGSEWNSSNRPCSWVEIVCTVGNKSAEGAVFVPKLSCLSKSADEIMKCITGHPASMEEDKSKKIEITIKALRHRKNLDNLKVLSSGCRHFIKLLAFQIHPFPFYITEAVDSSRLLDFLIYYREIHQWISNAILVQIIEDVIEALKYMLRKRMVARDITSYSVVVEIQSEKPRRSTNPTVLGLAIGNFVVKIADLSLACELPRDASSVTVTDNLPVPLRWTPSEALIEGIFSEKSMVYSLAFLMYECWTHGCQPFSFYDESMQTKQILLSFFGRGTEEKLEVDQWPCIPDEVFSLIRSCTCQQSERRPTLEELSQELPPISILEGSDDELQQGLETAIRMTDTYPVLSIQQKERKHLPEMGTSAIFDVEILV